MSIAAAVARYFEFEKHGTNFRQESWAGLTTFMATCYLIFVVPSMLADAGLPKDAAVGGTILVTVLITLLMGIWAKFPVCVAPGLGITAYFAYYVCGPAGFTWQAGLGAVLVSGIIFFLLTVTRVRQHILNAIPMDLKLATVVGIGAYIAFIGLTNCSIIVANPSSFVSLGSVAKPEALLAVFGFFLTAVLMVKNVKIALAAGIIATTALGVALGVTPLPEGDFFTLALPDLSGTFFKLDLAGALGHGLVAIIFTLTMVDLFDNMGTLIGLSKKAGFMKEDGHIENLDRAFITDSIGTMASSLIGTTTATSFIESAAGIGAGGRTGFTAVICAACFAAAIFFIPLVSIVPAYATAPILVLVGALMMQEVVHIRFERLDVAIPAFLTIIGMPLTFNVATGLGFGFIAWTAIRLFSGRWRELGPALVIISICFAVNFAMRG